MSAVAAKPNAAALAAIESHGRYTEACLRNADQAAVAHDWPVESMWRAEAAWNAERALAVAQGA